MVKSGVPIAGLKVTVSAAGVIDVGPPLLLAEPPLLLEPPQAERTTKDSGTTKDNILRVKPLILNFMFNHP